MAKGLAVVTALAEGRVIRGASPERSPVRLYWDSHSRCLRDATDHTIRLFWFEAIFGDEWEIEEDREG